MEKIYELKFGQRLVGAETITVGTRHQTQQAMKEYLDKKGIEVSYFRSWNEEEDVIVTDFGSHHYFFYLVEHEGIDPEKIEEELRQEEECAACKEWEKYYGEGSEYEAFKESLAFRDHARGMKIAQELLQENYVVLLSLEEELLIVSYEWSPGSDQSHLEYHSFL